MNFNKAFIGQRVPKQLANSSLYPEKKKKDWLENAYFLTFIYSEKATKFCEISSLLLFYPMYIVPVKNKVDISQNFLAFSEYMNFKEIGM